MSTPPTQAHRQYAAKALAKQSIVLSSTECDGIEIADFGLGRFEVEGLALHVYINNERYCAKELVMIPGQTCPEHRHPPVGGDPGKMETFRCRAGLVHLYVEGEPAAHPAATVPEKSRAHYHVFHEITLAPGDQYTIPPDTWHWFQAGDGGCIVSEFSSTSRDELDEFRNPDIRRV